jgi:hypothetical protein
MVGCWMLSSWCARWERCAGNSTMEHVEAWQMATGVRDIELTNK